MNVVIRKNDLLDRERLEDIFRHLQEHPSKQVEECLDLLSSLRADLGTSEKVRITAQLRHVLSKYQWVVQVSPTAEGFRAIYFNADRGKLSRDEQWERDAIRDLLEAVPYLGKWPRIRRCDECHEWFLAKRDDQRQRWCPGTCRQHHYDSDPKIRAEKKRYMREYRRVVKKLAENSEKNARKSLR